MITGMKGNTKRAQQNIWSALTKRFCSALFSPGSHQAVFAKGCAMALKYEQHLQGCKDQPCPPANDRPCDRKAFRFMNKPVREKDFEPPAILQVAHEPNQEVRSRLLAKEKCGRFALSFFQSREAARSFFGRLKQRFNEEAYARWGDHVGEIDLNERDGRMSEPDQKGHINLHQDADAQFAARVLAYHKL